MAGEQKKTQMLDEEEKEEERGSEEERKRGRSRSTKCGTDQITLALLFL